MLSEALELLDDILYSIFYILHSILFLIIGTRGMTVTN